MDAAELVQLEERLQVVGDVAEDEQDAELKVGVEILDTTEEVIGVQAVVREIAPETAAGGTEDKVGDYAGCKLNRNQVYESNDGIAGLRLLADVQVLPVQMCVIATRVDIVGN